MTASSRRSPPSPRPRPPRAQPTPPAPRRELVHRGDNAYANSMADAVNQFADPFLNAPPPEQGTAGVVANYLNGAMGLVGAPAQLIDTAIAQGLGALSNVPVLGALIKAWPSMPAATILSATHLAPPHAHLHPPSFVPPATPIPLPSFGPVMLSGCVSVLIEGVPAARCGDVGLAITCGSLAPPFEIMTGSSTVFIGGARAARLTDLTRHCNPMGALGAFAKVMAVAGAAAGLANALAMSNESDALAARGRDAAAESLEADGEAEAASAAGEAQNLAAESAGKSLAATMAAAQAAADAGALAMSVLCGKDLGVGITMGALVGAPGTVSIGGIPMPNLGQMIMGKAFEKLKALGKKLRRRGAAPDANGTHCNAGHPVDVISGAVFDRYLDAVTAGGFRWERHYTTARMREMGPTGWGMRHSLEHELHVRLHRCVYVDWRGRRVEFPRFRPGASRVSRFGYALERLPDHRYRVTYRDEPALVFRARPFETDATLESVCARDVSLALAYDAAGHLTGFTEHRDGEAPRAHRITYDDAWRIVAVEGSTDDGRAWRCGYAYDRDGCLAVARDAHGHDERYAYDERHRLTAWTDRRGYTYRWRYDADDRCVWTSGEDGQWSTELEYAPSKSETRVTTAPGAVWTYQYDPADGVLLRIEDPYGGEYLRERDEADGRVLREVDWAGRAWALTYDADGANVGRVDPFGRSLPTQVERPLPDAPVPRRRPSTAQAYVYGGCARVDADAAWRGVAASWWWQLPEFVHEAAGRAIAWADGVAPARRSVERDALGRVVSERDDRGRARAWRWDAAGNLVARQDRAGRVWRREVARWNLVGAEVDPLGHRVSYAHTDDEKVRRVVDAGGTETEYRYDLKGRLSEVWRHGAPRDAYAYDLRDRLVEKRDGAGRVLLRVTPHENGMPAVIEPAVGATITLDYDVRGRATRADAGEHRVELRRDAMLRRLYDLRDDVGVVHRWRADGVERSTVLGRFAVTYARDGAGGVRVRGPSGRVERVRWDESGAVLRECFGGAREFLRYDDEGRLAGRVAWRQGEREVSCARYLRNGEGELVRVEDDARGVTMYHLDDAGRLVDVEGPCGAREAYAYDPAGNLVAMPGASYVEHGDGNRLRQVDDEVFVYDDRHHVAVRQRPDGAWHYRHDSLGQLIEAHWEPRDGAPLVWTASYDGLGRRVARTVDGARWEYWWDGDRIAAERGPDGAVRVYVYAGPEALSPLGFVDYASADADPASGRAYSVFHDALGAPSRVEDETGRTVWRAQRSTAYGALTVDPRSTLRYDARWPGHWFDDALGLHCNRFRHYDPRLGRYLESDPLGLGGGLNVYAYCAHPASAVDLLGLHPDNDDHSTTKHGEGDGHVTKEQTPAEKPAAHHDDEHPRPRILVDENIGPGKTPEEAARAMWERTREHVEGQVEPRRQATELGREQHEIAQQRQALNERARAAAQEQGAAGREIGAARRERDTATQHDDAAGVARADKREQTARERQDAARQEQERVASERTALDQREADVVQRRSEVGADPDHSPMAVHESAYDPTTGRLVVVSSGSEPASPSVRVPSESLDTTNPGHCGMPRAAGVLMDDHPNGQPPAPIMTTQGGLRLDNDGNISHVSACRNCENIVDNNPITHVGGNPPGVPDNVPPNVSTPLDPNALHNWQP